jgi:hypothetical protein
MELRKLRPRTIPSSTAGCLTNEVRGKSPRSLPDSRNRVTKPPSHRSRTPSPATDCLNKPIPCQSPHTLVCQVRPSVGLSDTRSTCPRIIDSQVPHRPNLVSNSTTLARRRRTSAGNVERKPGRIQCDPQRPTDSRLTPCQPARCSATKLSRVPTASKRNQVENNPTLHGHSVSKSQQSQCQSPHAQPTNSLKC